MKRLVYISTLNGGKVSEGFPLTTVQPWGDKTAPYILLGYWYQQKIGDNKYQWVHTGQIVQVEPGVPLSIEDGNVVVKRGEIKLETSGLWLRNVGEGVKSDEVVAWFANYVPDHFFTSGDKPACSYKFVAENCDLHYCEDGFHLLATVRVGSQIKVSETRTVRKAGTGKCLFNFSKYLDVTRDTQNLQIDGLSVEALQEALRVGKAERTVEIEMYTLSGKRELSTVSSSLTKEALELQVKEKGFSRYSEIVHA